MNSFTQLPSLEELRAFIEVARHLNFRAAARALGVSPGALGQRVRKLEDCVGEALFVRSTRHVTLTRAGANLLPSATSAITAAARCLSAAKGESAPVPSDLVIGTRHELGLSFLVPLLPALSAAQPALSLHLYFGSSTDLIARVRALDIDCAIGSMRVTDARLEALPLHEEEYVFVGSTTLLARCPLRRPEHAEHHTLIDTHAELPLFRYWRDAPRGGDRLRFERVSRMGTIAAIRHRVLQSEGVAVLPRYFVAGDLKARRLSIAFPSVKLLSDEFRLVFRRDDARRHVYETLAQWLREEPLK